MTPARNKTIRELRFRNTFRYTSVRPYQTWSVRWIRSMLALPAEHMTLARTSGANLANPEENLLFRFHQWVQRRCSSWQSWSMVLAGWQAGRLMDPAKLVGASIGPSQRAQQTWRMFVRMKVSQEAAAQIPNITTGELAEWNSGRYEGKVAHLIRTLGREHQLDPSKSVGYMD